MRRPQAPRHAWVKLRLHCYICRQCGCGKVNSQQDSGRWVATYHRPNGTSVTTRATPPCEPGPRTSQYLAHYAAAIAIANAATPPPADSVDRGADA